MATLLRFCAVGLMWGSSYFWIKLAMQGLTSAQLGFARVLVGAVAMLAVLFAMGGRLPSKATWWLHLIAIAVLTTSLPVVLLLVVPDATGADYGMVSTFNASVPVLLLTLHLAAGRRSAPARTYLGIVLGFAGVLLMFPPWDSAERWLTWGSLVNFAAAAAYGLAMIWMYRLMHDGGLTAIQVSAGQAVLGVVWAALSLPYGGLDTAPRLSVTVLLAVAVLGVLNTAVVFTFFTCLIRDEGALSASTVLYPVPVVLVLGQVLLENHRLAPLTVLGMAVVVLGTALARSAPRAAVDEARQLADARN